LEKWEHLYKSGDEKKIKEEMEALNTYSMHDINEVMQSQMDDVNDVINCFYINSKE